MKKYLEEIYKNPIVPVVALEDENDALPLAEALCEGGLYSAEITFRTDAAENAIKTISEENPEMLVGAGTIVNVEQAKTAVNAGAKFLVSPGTSEDILKYAKDNNILMFPGVCTPSDIITCLKYDISVVKFFPSKAYGGLSTIKSLAPVFPNIKFMPTGGVNIENLGEYLSEPEIFACGGSWMVKSDLINNGDFNKITSLAKEAVDLAKKYR